MDSLEGFTKRGSSNQVARLVYEYNTFASSDLFYKTCGV